MKLTIKLREEFALCGDEYLQEEDVEANIWADDSYVYLEIKPPSFEAKLYSIPIMLLLSVIGNQRRN